MQHFSHHFHGWMVESMSISSSHCAHLSHLVRRVPSAIGGGIGDSSSLENSVFSFFLKKRKTSLIGHILRALISEFSEK